MRQVNTLQELRAERARLMVRKEILENDMQRQVTALKEELKPLQLVKKGAEKVLVGENNSLLDFSFGMLAKTITRNLVLRNAGFITKLIVPILVKNLTSNVVHDNKDRILGWLGNVITKISSKKHHAHNGHHPSFDRGTAHTEYNY